MEIKIHFIKNKFILQWANLRNLLPQEYNWVELIGKHLKKSAKLHKKGMKLKLNNIQSKKPFYLLKAIKHKEVKNQIKNIKLQLAKGRKAYQNWRPHNQNT